MELNREDSRGLELCEGQCAVLLYMSCMIKCKLKIVLSVNQRSIVL